jgi:hypothetical protein
MNDLKHTSNLFAFFLRFDLQVQQTPSRSTFFGVSLLQLHLRHHVVVPSESESKSKAAVIELMDFIVVR